MRAPKNGVLGSQADSYTQLQAAQDTPPRAIFRHSHIRATVKHEVGEDGWKGEMGGKKTRKGKIRMEKQKQIQNQKQKVMLDNERESTERVLQLLSADAVCCAI